MVWSVGYMTVHVVVLEAIVVTVYICKCIIDSDTFWKELRHQIFLHLNTYVYMFVFKHDKVF